MNWLRCCRKKKKKPVENNINQETNLVKFINLSTILYCGIYYIKESKYIEDTKELLKENSLLKQQIKELQNKDKLRLQKKNETANKSKNSKTLYQKSFKNQQINKSTK